MNIVLIITIVAAVLLVSITFAFRYFRKSKSNLKLNQAKQKKAFKIIMKKNKPLDKSSQELEAYNKDLLKNYNDMVNRGKDKLR